MCFGKNNFFLENGSFGIWLTGPYLLFLAYAKAYVWDFFSLLCELFNNSNTIRKVAEVLLLLKKPPSETSSEAVTNKFFY